MSNMDADSLRMLSERGSKAPAAKRQQLYCESILGGEGRLPKTRVGNLPAYVTKR